MTLRLDEMECFHNLMKIGTEKNKAIYSTCINKVALCFAGDTKISIINFYDKHNTCNTVEST